jgi:PAS domain S-box-containing protein
MLDSLKALFAQGHERKHAEQPLPCPEGYFRSLVEHAVDLITLLDGDGVVCYASPSHYTVLGYKPEDLVGRNAFDLVHPDDRPYAMESFAAAIHTPGVPQSVECRFRHAGGTWCTLEARGNGVPDDPTIAGVVVTAHDVTARCRAEEAARQHQAALAQVLRVSTVGEMTAGLAHEVNQPLSAIVSYAKGCARRLRAGTGSPAELLEVLDEIARQAVRANEIVRRVDTLIRKDGPHRAQVDLNDVVREVTRCIGAEAREQNITMDLALDGAIPPVHVDGLRIEQVILNLVRNGFDAMGGAGSGESVLSIRTSMSGAQMVEVAIADSGNGVRAEIAEKMFAPFVSTKPHGMGMGLAISRAIIQAHGGRLWATPNPTRGMTFSFTVPVETEGSGDAA